VKIAFHFEAYPESCRGIHSLCIKESFFRSLLSSPFEDVHLKIFEGALLVHDYLNSDEKKDVLITGLLGYHLPIWRALDDAQFRSALVSRDIWVLAVEGMTPKLRDYICLELGKEDSWLGALQVYEASPVHWDLYSGKLPPRCRFLNGEVRVFYYMSDEDSKDKRLADFFKGLPFKSVGWEDLGARHTVFDVYDSPEHAKRVAELSDELSEHLAHMADDVLLRLGDINPHLRDNLHAALKRFELTDTVDALSHASGSCRRFLQGLADTLYQPRSELVDGTKVGPQEYRNRLWAYVKEKLEGKRDERERERVLADLDDIATRLDKIDILCSKGVHGNISRPDLHRLIISLILVTYDMVCLEPPPLNVPLAPHFGEIEKFMEWQRKIRPAKSDDE